MVCPVGEQGLAPCGDTDEADSEGLGLPWWDQDEEGRKIVCVCGGGGGVQNLKRHQKLGHQDNLFFSLSFFIKMEITYHKTRPSRVSS